MESKEKKYYDAQIQILLDKYISKEQYQDFKSIIDEVFQRRAYEYEFSPGRIEKEIKNFLKNVKSIEFDDEKKLNNGNKVLGSYDKIEHKILLNKSEFEKQKFLSFSPEYCGKMLFETFSHEAYHAINDNGRVIGLEKFFQNVFHLKEGETLNEVVTENASQRTTSNYKNSLESDEYSLLTTGYSTITFATNMLANALGVSEKSLLKHSLNDRDELMEFYLSRFPENNKEEAIQLWDKFEVILDENYNQINKNNDTLSDSSNNVYFSINELYSSIYDIALFQIKSQNQDLSDEYMGEIQTRLELMKKVMNQSMKNQKEIDKIKLKDYNSKLTKEELDEIKEECDKISKNIENYIVGKYEVDKEKIPVDSKEYEYAQKGMLVDYVEMIGSKYFPNRKTLEYKDVEQEILKKGITDKSIFSYREKIRQDDYNQEQVWDDSIYTDFYEIALKEIKKDEIKKTENKAVSQSYTEEYNKEFKTSKFQEIEKDDDNRFFSFDDDEENEIIVEQKQSISDKIKNLFQKIFNKEKIKRLDEPKEISNSQLNQNSTFNVPKVETPRIDSSLLQKNDGKLTEEKTIRNWEDR